MAGYSGTPLAKKLGVKEGHTVAVLGAPTGFGEVLGETLPADVVLRAQARGRADVVLSFHTRRADLERRLPTLSSVMAVDGGLWIAWPKRSSGVPTDITEDTLREVLLPTGLVDVKVCAIDDTWSGLRFCWRKDLRASRT